MYGRSVSVVSPRRVVLPVTDNLDVVMCDGRCAVTCNELCRFCLCVSLISGGVGGEFIARARKVNDRCLMCDMMLSCT